MNWRGPGANLATHPSLEGHFPGNPVVPGVVLLEQVLTACRNFLPQHPVSGLRSVKFHRPVRPGDRFVIELERDGGNEIRFRCANDGAVFAAGRILLGVGDES